MYTPRGVMCHCFSDFCSLAANIYEGRIIIDLSSINSVSCRQHPRKTDKNLHDPCSRKKKGRFLLFVPHLFLLHHDSILIGMDGKNIQCLMILSHKNKHIKIERHILLRILCKYSAENT